MKNETRTQEVWIAEDGREFLSEVECKEYELKVLKRLNDMKFFVVVHGPDLTEGRGHYGRTYFAVEAKYASEYAVEDWCERRFRSRIAYVQGCGPMRNWSVHESSREQWENPQPARVGDYNHEPKKVYIIWGDEKPLEGYPEPYRWQKGGGFVPEPKEKK